MTKGKFPTAMSSSAAVPPPWEVVSLVVHHLDPKTLAVASCVCKSWRISMSSDQIWQPICTTLYPSVSAMKTTTCPTSVSYRRLFSIASAASKTRSKTPPKPHLSLADLIFAVNISHIKNRAPILSLAKPGAEIEVEPNGRFKFDLGLGNLAHFLASEESEAVRIAWNVVFRDWSAVFTVMDCKGKVKFSPGDYGWFSPELPPPGCCCLNGGEMGSGIFGDLKVEFCGEINRDEGEGGGGGWVRVGKAKVGMLSAAEWRYMSLDGGLRYLQHFLGQGQQM